MPERIFEELAARVLRHHDQPATTWESHMTRIASARAAIAHADEQLAMLAGNQLAEAIIEDGAGASFGPQDVALVLAMVRAIEHGPGQAQPAPMPPAVQVQPQMPV